MQRPHLKTAPGLWREGSWSRLRFGPAACERRADGVPAHLSSEGSSSS